MNTPRDVTKNGEPSRMETWPRVVKMMVVKYCETIRKDAWLCGIDYSTGKITGECSLIFTFNNGEYDEVRWDR